VVALGSKHHSGAEYFVIRQPDRTLALLAAWMTEPGQAAVRLHAARQQTVLADPVEAGGQHVD
jgi:hypothetical protein